MVEPLELEGCDHFRLPTDAVDDHRRNTLAKVQDQTPSRPISK